MPASDETARALLRWYAAMGVDVLIPETPGDWRAAETVRAVPAEPRRPASAEPPPLRLEARPGRPPAAPQTEPWAEDALKDARLAAESAGDLAALREAIARFEGCPLKAGARSTVFADGNPGSSLMLIGEAPGAEEDRQGLPFVGRSGKLLDAMLAAIGRDRTSAYISNILPWRPPANRQPTLSEVVVCLPFIRRHITLVAPKAVVLLGGTAAKHLLETEEGITRLRGRWFTLDAGGLSVPALPTFHPAFLLRQPNLKRLAWTDLLALERRLES